MQPSTRSATFVKNKSLRKVGLFFASRYSLTVCCFFVHKERTASLGSAYNLQGKRQPVAWHTVFPSLFRADVIDNRIRWHGNGLVFVCTRHVPRGSFPARQARALEEHDLTCGPWRPGPGARTSGCSASVGSRLLADGAAWPSVPLTPPTANTLSITNGRRQNFPILFFSLRATAIVREWSMWQLAVRLSCHLWPVWRHVVVFSCREPSPRRHPVQPSGPKRFTDDLRLGILGLSF